MLALRCQFSCITSARARTSPPGWPLSPLLDQLKLGVVVFFVISGLVLYLPYARAIRDRRALPGWRAFAKRRAIRIIPAYWVILAVLAIGPQAGGIASGDWWRYFGLLQIYSPHTVLGGLGVAWSLCVEVSFYAALPFLAAAIARLVRGREPGAAVRIQLLIAAGLAAVSLLLRFALTRSIVAAVPHADIVLATSLPGLLDWFAVGIGLAVVTAEWESGSHRFARLAGAAAHPGRCWSLSAAFFLLAAVAQPREQFLTQYSLLGHLAATAVGALIVLGVIGSVHRAARPRHNPILQSAVMVWLGAISYGIYLWHDPLIRAIHGAFSPSPLHPASALSALGLLIVVLLGTVALAAASWYLVERPAQRLARRTTLNFRTPAAGSSPARPGKASGQAATGSRAHRRAAARAAAR